MSKARYRINEISPGTYQLFHQDLSLAIFTRANFRECIEKVAYEWNLSSNWVGMILKLLNKNFPVPVVESKRTALDRLIVKVGEQGIVDYLRQKGFRIVKKIDVSDVEIVRYLEKAGYEVEGLVNDVYYSSSILSRSLRS